MTNIQCITIMTVVLLFIAAVFMLPRRISNKKIRTIIYVAGTLVAYAGLFIFMMALSDADRIQRILKLVLKAGLQCATILVAFIIAFTVTSTLKNKFEKKE